MEAVFMEKEIRMRSPWREHAVVLLLLPTGVALLVFFFLPIFFLFLLSLRKYIIGTPPSPLTLTNYLHFLSDPFYIDILWSTLKLGLGVTGITLVLGYPVAYFLVRTRLPGKNWLRLAVITPLLVSVVVRTYGWLILLSDRGLVNQALVGWGLVDHPIKLLFTYNGVLIGLTHVFLPFMILSLVGVIENINPSLEDAAENLGANWIRRFVWITLPLSLPGIVAGSLLVFSLSIAAYVTPEILGGPSLLVLSTMVYQQIMVVLDWGFGAAIAAILLLMTLVVIFAYTKILSLGKAWEV